MTDTNKRHLPLAAEIPEITRRSMLATLAAGAAVAGCARDRSGKILPYTRNPRQVTPGIPRYYATSLTLDGYATGVLVESHDGRPTKIEGNPDHPASLGAAGVIEQASVLGLYDPDRAVRPRGPRGPITFEGLRQALGGLRPDDGARLRLLLEPTGSPLLGALMPRVVARHPRARFTFWSATRPGFVEEGARLALGAPAQPLFDAGAADVIVSFDDDFLASGPFSLHHARRFAGKRRPSGEGMSRLYVVETMPTPTGTLADHRIRLRPGEIGNLAARVAAELAALGPPRPPPAAVLAALSRFRAAPGDSIAAAIARDLRRSAGRAVITVGPGQPPLVHALGQLIQAMLGGDRVAWNIAPTLISAGAAEQPLSALAAEMAAGAVDTLVILAPNPAYTAPADLALSGLLAGVRDVVYLASHDDETAARAGWVIPRAHALESWGDAAAYDGTLSLIQPLIAPLHGGVTEAELLAVFAGDRNPEARPLLADLWSSRWGGDFTARWEQALTLGLIEGTAGAPLLTNLQAEGLSAAIAGFSPPPSAGLEIRFAPDPYVYDGRFTNNPWLIELPRPITKLTWENAAMLSPATARRLGVETEGVVDLELSGRRVRAPVLVVPGHADDAVTVFLGFGRAGGERVASGAGFDASRIRTSGSPTFAAGLAVHPIGGERRPLSLSQLHLRDEGRPIALHTTLAELAKDPHFTAHLTGEQPTLLPPWPAAGDQWAMTIDNTLCTGCSACVAACQAENNILVVGKEEVGRGRLMHWIRIDSYLHGPEEDPRTVHEPMLCQHCEHAPCEYVCPVNATVHSPDGLNDMVYNRCVGTRFCSNNCPYKVRRFNWFDYGERREENAGLRALQKNPDVTVRQRGVMEKCTYCVQRIREAEIRARVEGRAIRPGEVVTACQQACPTEAIQFGSLAHEDTRMVRWRAEPRRYAVLHELGTRPRTLYLARVSNPNPEMP